MITFKVSGFVELEKALRQLPQEVAGRALQTALRKAGQPMVDEARATAIRSTKPGPQGHMADSIKLRSFKTEGPNDLESNLWFGPDPQHFYGIFHEFGTRVHAARPFLRPAWDAGKDKALDDFGKALWKAIERAAKRLHRGT